MWLATACVCLCLLASYVAGRAIKFGGGFNGAAFTPPLVIAQSLSSVEIGRAPALLIDLC